MADKKTETPGEGLRSLRTTTLFRITNFELYAKPNAIVMGLGILGITLSVGYILYMNHKHEKMGLVNVIGEDGQEVLQKRKSRWDI